MKEFDFNTKVINIIILYLYIIFKIIYSNCYLFVLFFMFSNSCFFLFLNIEIREQDIEINNSYFLLKRKLKE